MRLLVLALLMTAMYGSFSSTVSMAYAMPNARTIQAASFPFSDGFESATFGADWSTTLTGNGVSEVTSDYPYSGNRSAFLGQRVGGDATATLNLAVNLSGQTTVFLDVWMRATGGGGYRGVQISDDAGANYKTIAVLDTTSQSFSHHVFDIASAASAQGLALNSAFRIRFYYVSFSYGNSKANDGLIVDDVRLTGRDQQLATFPYSQDDFEASSLQQGLFPQSFDNGVVEVSTDYPHTGKKSVFLGQKIPGSATSILTLAIDLSGQQNVFLDVWVRATGGGGYRGISISDDGGANYKQVVSLDSASQKFSHQLIDLGSEATTRGLVLNNKFRIQFYYVSLDYGKGKASDGLILDNLRLTTREQQYAPFPYVQESDGTGVFQQGLFPQSFSNGTAEISSAYPFGGRESVFLGQKADGCASGFLTLPMNLSGQSQVVLDFWARSTGGGGYKGVSISDDGGKTYKQLISLDRMPETFKYYVIDVASAAKEQGLTLNDRFRILFYYQGPDYCYGKTGYGIAIQQIRLGTSAVSAPSGKIQTFLPFIRR